MKAYPDSIIRNFSGESYSAKERTRIRQALEARQSIRLQRAVERLKAKGVRIK